MPEPTQGGSPPLTTKTKTRTKTVVATLVILVGLGIIVAVGAARVRRGPDLVISEISLRNDPAGLFYRIDYLNRGTATATNPELNVKVVTPTRSELTTTTAVAYTGSLERGASGTMTGLFPYSALFDRSDAPYGFSGTVLQAFIDPNRSITESNETNNRMTKRVPDLGGSGGPSPAEATVPSCGPISTECPADWSCANGSCLANCPVPATPGAQPSDACASGDRCLIGNCVGGNTRAATSTSALPDRASSFSVERMFPGQYDNVKYKFIIADPEGVSYWLATKTDGSSIGGGEPPCLTSMETGVVDLFPSDFPLTVTIRDCNTPGITSTFTVSMPPLP